MAKRRHASAQETEDLHAHIDRLEKANADCVAEREQMLVELKSCQARVERLEKMLKNLIQNTDPSIDLDT